MPLAIDGSSPAVAVNSVATTATVATASFTPPAGAFLLISWSGNTGPGVDPAAPSITDNLGVHLTYGLIGWKHRSVGTIVDGQTAMWWAVVGSSAAMTVTVTTGTASGAREAALKVRVMTGADTSGVGASGVAGSASAASIAQSYTAQATGGQGFISVCDWDLKGVQTAGTGCTSDGSANIGTAITYGFQRRTSADDSNGVSNTLNVTLPGTSTNLAWVYAEIKPAAGGAAPAFPPSRQVRRLLATAPRLPRGSARISTPVRAQVNPPFPFNSVKQPRRLRALAPRRGESAMPVPSQVVVPTPKLSPPTVRPRLKALRLSRGRITSPVPPQIAVAPPAYPPLSVRTRLRGLRLFRGHAVSPVPAQVVVTPATFVPQPVHARIKGLRLFRGRAAAPVHGHPAPSALAPHTRPRTLAPRRGHATGPVPPQVVVLPPAYPLRPVRSRLKGLRPVRGHQAAMPVPAQVVIVAPKFPPLFSRIKQHAVRIFRGGTRTVAQTPEAPVITPASVGFGGGATTGGHGGTGSVAATDTTSTAGSMGNTSSGTGAVN